MRRFLSRLGLLAGLCLAFGFLGRWHPAGDTFALLRPGAALGLCLCAWALRPRWLSWAALAAGLIGLATVALPFWPQPAGGDLRVYSKNLLFSNGEMELIRDDVLAADVDLVFLQEVSRHNERILALLAAEFPHQHWCPLSQSHSPALLSRHPFDGAPRCTALRALAAAPILINAQRVWAVSAHIPWPWPAESRAEEEQAWALLGELAGPIVIGGDFNMTPWSYRISQTAAQSRTRLAGPLRGTRPMGPVPMPIDLVLAPYGGRLERRPMLGSDHAGVVADVQLWPDLRLH